MEQRDCILCHVPSHHWWIASVCVKNSSLYSIFCHTHINTNVPSRFGAEMFISSLLVLVRSWEISRTGFISCMYSRIFVIILSIADFLSPCQPRTSPCFALVSFVWWWRIGELANPVPGVKIFKPFSVNWRSLVWQGCCPSSLKSWICSFLRRKEQIQYPTQALVFQSSTLRTWVTWARWDLSWKIQPNRNN